MATMHRTLIEQFLSGRHGVEIVGLLPFNRQHDGPVPGLPVPVVAGTDSRERDHYRDVLHTTRPDVVLFQHIAHRWAAYHAGMYRDIPAVGVVHSWNPLQFGSAEKAARVRRTVNEALSGCASLVFVSDWTRREGADLGFDFPGPATIIHNPLQPVFTRWLPAGARPRHGWVFVGSLIDRKNPMLALAAAAHCGRSLTLIGDGPLLPALRSAAEALNLTERVRFTGWLPPGQVRQQLSRAELLCVPSAGEGFSMAYLEALSCGTPVVGMEANVRELVALLGPACGAVVTGSGADEVIAAAGRIRPSARERRRLRQLTVQRFSPDTVARRYASHLRAVRAGA